MRKNASKYFFGATAGSAANDFIVFTFAQVKPRLPADFFNKLTEKRPYLAAKRENSVRLVRAFSPKRPGLSTCALGSDQASALYDVA
jgi:hypothetical protein